MSSNFSPCGNLTVSGNVPILYLHYEDGLRYLSLYFLLLEFLEGGRCYVIASGLFCWKQEQYRNQEEWSFWSFICEISDRYLEIIDVINPLLQTLLSFFSGIIDFLVSQHPIAKVLRDHLVFKIAPMLNPDGVYLGNYRYGVEYESACHYICFIHPTLFCHWILYGLFQFTPLKLEVLTWPYASWHSCQGRELNSKFACFRR